VSDERDHSEAEPTAPEFELPLPSEGEEVEHRLRRGLFGYRREDVDAAISSRDRQIDELRRDVAALWLAFGQHERTIRELLAAIETLGGPRLEPPGGREGPAPGPEPETSGPPEAPGPAAPSPAPAPEPIGEQLAGLDEVLAAIEAATHSLERAYADEISRAEDAEENKRDDREAPGEEESGSDNQEERDEPKSSGQGEPGEEENDS
jgi:hypothetical protein